MALAPVFKTRSLYKGFRERTAEYGKQSEPTTADGVTVCQANFESQAADVLLEQDRKFVANRQFPYPVFLPSDPPPGGFDRIVVILNGLNETEYRKFFPWGATLARHGIPALVFPIAFHINRRPAAWSAESAQAEHLVRRATLPANEMSTSFNAVLSERLAEHPSRFFRAGLQTLQDLTVLAENLRSGRWSPGVTGPPVLKPNCHVHLLGYSVGGYLSVAIKLHPPTADLFRRAMIFCGGAPGLGEPGLRANPVSELIVDLDASVTLRDHFSRIDRSVAPWNAPEADLFDQIILRSDASIRKRLAEIRSEILVVAGRKDKVIPAAGVEAQLGWVDHVLDLGIHEYPFTLDAYPAQGADRKIVGSYDVSPEYRDVFQEFAGMSVEFFGATQF
jgi:hypothetical protein